MVHFDKCTNFIEGLFSCMSCSYAKECDSCVKSAFIYSFLVLNSEPWRLACGMLYGIWLQIENFLYSNGYKYRDTVLFWVSVWHSVLLEICSEVNYLLIMGRCYKEIWLNVPKISSLKTCSKAATVNLRYRMWKIPIRTKWCCCTEKIFGENEHWNTGLLWDFRLITYFPLLLSCCSIYNYFIAYLMTY